MIEHNRDKFYLTDIPREVWYPSFTSYISYLYHIGHDEYSPNQISELENAFQAAWKSAKLEAAQHRMHLTAFGARLAWLFFGFILLLAMVLVIIGGN